MPSFSYKGYDFEVDHVPTEEEFQQMSAHVDTLPPKGIKQDNEVDLSNVSTALKSAFAQTGNVVDRYVSGLAGHIATREKESPEAIDEGFRQMQERLKAREEWANPEHKELTTGQKVLGAAVTLPMQVLSAPFSPASTGQTALEAGESLPRATAATGIDTTGNVIGFGIGPMGKGVLRPVISSAAVNAAQEYGTKEAIQSVMETKKGKKTFEPTASDTLTAALVGGAYGTIHSKPIQKEVTPRVARGIEELNAKEPTPQEIPGLKATEGHEGQMALFDIPEEGRMPNKYEAVTGDWRIDENGMPIKADLSMDVQNAQMPLQRNLWGDELAQKHPQENVANIPQAIDMMESPPWKGSPRDEALSRLQGELQAPGELQAAVMEANSPFRGLGKKQAGAINPKVFKEGFEKIKELANGVVLKAIGQGENLKIEAYKDGERVAGALYEPTNKYDAPADSDLKATMLGSKKRGTATEIYRFASELGNDVVPSKKLTAGGAGTWGKMEREGLSTGMKIPKSQRGAVLVDWSQNQKADSLKNIPGVGDRLKEVGNALINTPEEAIKLAKDHGDVEQNMVQRGINALTKGGTYLKAKVNNPVVHFVVDRFLKADTLAKAEISDKLHATYLPALRDLPTKERVEVFTLLNAADLNKKTITPEQMQRWGLSKAQQDFITLHNTRMNEVLGKINEVRAAVGKKPITSREAYSAMNMTGDFRKVAYKLNPQTGAKEVVGVIGANSKTLGSNALSKLEAKMKSKDPSIEFGPLQDMSKGRSVKGSPHEAFMDALKVLGEENPNIRQFLDTLAEVAKDDSSNYMGMQKHTMQKKGVWGMEGRKPWLSVEDNARQFFENQTKYMESAYNWAQLTKAAQDANHVIRDESVMAKHGEAIKLSEKYMQNALGLNPSEFGVGLEKAFNALFGTVGIGPSVPRTGLRITKQVANTALLSLNPMFLGIQLIQPMAAMPGMASMIASLGAGKSMTFGLVELSKGSITLMKKQLAPGTLNAIEKGAFDYAKKNHVYAADMVEHANQVSKGKAYYTTKVTQAPAAAVEQVTRANMYMGLVHLLDKGGLKAKDGLYEQAHRFTDMAMNNYAAIEKPAIYNALGPIGSVAYNLKSYGHNEISRWSMYARELGEQGNAKPILTQMASTIALAGVMGLPFFSQWEEVYNQITKAIGSPRSLALDTMKMSEELGKNLGPKGQYALSHGMFTLAGVDLSKRVGLGDVIPSHASDVAFAGGGKLGGMAKSAYQLATSPSEETAKAAAFNWSPQVLQGPMDVAWYQKGNLAYSKDPMNLKPVAERDATDVLLKKIGLTGIHESVQKTKQYEQKQITKDITDYRSKAMHQIAQDLFRNRELSQKTIDRYFVDGQGDPNTFQKDFQKLVLEQNLAPQQATLLYNAASNRIPQLRALQRQVQ